MTTDEAEKAAKEAAELIAAVIRVAQNLDLSPRQMAEALLDAVTECPRAPHWWNALARLNADGVRMLKPATAQALQSKAKAAK